MASEERSQPLGLAVRLFPFVTAIVATAFTYWGLRSVWVQAPEMAPYVGTSAETMRLLLILTLPVSPAVLMILGMLCLGVRLNQGLIPRFGG